ncbi:hypothetical protein AYX14_06228 [Cryptococcus neoformans]|nr:hypothetical protein AYX14_06228 [Cryptococcus neoformans var. grubii]
MQSKQSTYPIAYCPAGNPETRDRSCVYEHDSIMMVLCYAILFGVVAFCFLEAFIFKFEAKVMPALITSSRKRDNPQVSPGYRLVNYHPSLYNRVISYPDDRRHA